MQYPTGRWIVLLVAGLIIHATCEEYRWENRQKQYEENLRIASRHPFRKFEKAAEEGDLATVKRLLDNGTPADLPIPCPADQWEGLPPSEPAIHKAARNGHLDIVRLLLDRGAKPDAPSSDGFTPLSQTNDLEIAKLLISRGANVNARDHDGSQPIHYATIPENNEEKSITQSLALIKYLIEQGANPLAEDDDKEQPIHFAARMSDADVVSYFLGKGAKVNAAIRSKDDYFQNGYQPLHLAANRQDNAEHALKVCQLLLSKGADVHALTADGETPLHLSRNHAITELLLKHGAKIDASSKRGRQPIHHFALHGDTKSIRLLLDHGAKPDVLSADSITESPLDIAVFFNRSTDTAKLLMDRGAKPTKRTLSQAESSGNADMIRLLRTRHNAHPKRPPHRR